MIRITVRLFNSLSKYADGKTELSFNSAGNLTVGEILKSFSVPENEIFLLLHNGRNIMRGVGFNAGIEKDHLLKDGDILAFSGPIPFSRGYGAGVV